MIKRQFTEEGIYNIYDLFDWKKVDVKIKDFQTGEVIFEGHDLEFPEHYSQQACDIIASKYFYRNIDGKGIPETSLKQVVHRMVRFWVDALIDEGVIEGCSIENGNYDFDECIEYNCTNDFVGEAEILYDELVYTLLNQMWAPNSPQWFNTGIRYYGIKGDPDDFWYCDEKGTHKSLDRYTRSQTSACFIIPVTDHLIGKNSITDHFVTETKLFKGGSGVGTNFSPLRAEGEALSSGGHSSGVMSFLLGLDRNAGAIKSGGTTRRAAKMVILDVDHPDIEDFVDWKVHEEKKAQDLISLGYEGGMNGEAYQTVSGQNSNNSVRVSNEFMHKIVGVDPDNEWFLKGRTDSSKDKSVHAWELWDKICTAAWKCADPGIQFDDRYNDWHTAPNAGRINATNPCSEFAFIDNSACNLASINILKFLKNNHMDWDSFETMVTLIQMVLEASIYWGHYPTEEVAENSYKYRPTGLGITNLGALFLKKGYPYDSEDARDLAADICARMTARSYITSVEMAKIVGACEGFEDNKDDFIGVLEKHQGYAEDDCLFNAHKMYQIAIDKAEEYGVRNMQTTVMAPTGTISFAMDCDSTGIEPFFSHRVYKKCSDGSVMEMINPLAKEYVENIVTCEEEKEVIEDYFDDHDTYQGCSNLTSEEEQVLQTANEISPEAHVMMMAAIQPYISGSISKTVNLPADATVEDVKDIYQMAYAVGLKSISIYRDGSKGTQPLNVTLDEDSPSKIEELPYLNVLEKEKNQTKDVTLRVSDNQNYLIKASQIYIDIGSDQPIDLVLPTETKENHDSEENSDDFLERIKNKCKAIKLENNDSDEKPIFILDGLGTEETPNEFYEKFQNKEHKLTRTKPDGVRKSRTHAAKLGSVELYITVSYYSDGSLCEVFVSSDREGTTTKGLLSSLSKAISHMLQYGIEPEKIAQMLRNQQYEPAGHVERHPNIKMAASISDLIARVIEFECGDYIRCHVRPEEVEQEEEIKSTFIYKTEPVEKEIEQEKEYEKALSESRNDLPYSDEPCPVCGSYTLRPNGTCYICDNCFSTTGCS